jgi:hypothetical protein
MALQFVDRAVELEALEERYSSPNPEFFLIYGRRRVGKTELVKKFASGKAHFYFLAKEQAIDMETRRMVDKFSESFNIHLDATEDIERFFKQILGKLDLTKKFIFIIDEFPFWVSRHRTVLSEMQHLWDEVIGKANFFFILLGSSVSMMEHEVMAYKSPLYGRRTGQLRIEPMRPEHLHYFLPDYGIEDIVKVFGAMGGIPFYIKEFNAKVDFCRNVKNTFFNKSNILHEEAEVLLREELREVNTYFNIMKAIIDGSTRLTDIAQSSRVDITNINKYLSTLMSLGLVSKEHSVTQPPKLKNMLYRLEDNYFRFWLKFVYPYKEEIEEDVDSAGTILERELPQYMGPVFEDFCRKSMRGLDLPVLHFPGTKIGKWWYKEDEIDIVAINDKDGEILFAECKWKENVDAGKLLEELRGKASLVDWHPGKRKEHFALFARSFKERLKGTDVNLVDLGDLDRALKRKGLLAGN